PFHAELHLVMASVIGDRFCKVDMPNAHILRTLVGRRPLETLVAGDVDYRPTLFGYDHRIAESLDSRHAVDVHSRPDCAEDEWRIIEGRLRHILEARSEDVRLAHRPVLRLAVKVAALDRQSVV